jgi:hypothetical protein
MAAQRLPDLVPQCRGVAAPDLRVGAACLETPSECGHDVGGVAIDGLASSVVAHGGAGISMAGCFLDVAQRDTGVERSGDERVPQRVRPSAGVFVHRARRAIVPRTSRAMGGSELAAAAPRHALQRRPRQPSGLPLGRSCRSRRNVPSSLPTLTVTVAQSSWSYSLWTMTAH